MTRQKLEYVIGNVDGDQTLPSKFIVCRNKNKLMIYAAEFYIDSVSYLEEDCIQETPTYSKIAKDNGIKEEAILGGGKFKFVSRFAGIEFLKPKWVTKLVLYDYSRRYGSVPKEVAEQVGKEILGCTFTDTSGIEIIVEMPEIFPKEKIKIWKKLGFRVKDKNKKIIK